MKPKPQISYTTAKTDYDLKQILVLQAKNLPKQLSEHDKVMEGFVTVHHTFELLKRMNDAQPHIIAKVGGAIVGYALCMPPKFEDELDVLKPMFKEIKAAVNQSSSKDKQLNYLAENLLTNYIVMGQVCIDKEYRGQGLFRALYNAMKDSVISKYSAIITEVDVKNKRSLNAHYAIGFKDLKTYTSGGQDWKLIVLQ